MRRKTAHDDIDGQIVIIRVFLFGPIQPKKKTSIIEAPITIIEVFGLRSWWRHGSKTGVSWAFNCRSAVSNLLATALDEAPSVSVANKKNSC